MTASIEFRDVRRHFGSHEVLRGLSFAVAPAEVYAFLGRNGAGKTTALRILMGLLAPHAGRSSVLGKDSLTLAAADRDRIGFVGEGHHLDPTMRVRDAVAFERGTRPRFRADVTERALQRCGLRGGQFVMRLSRGQRAQLALILAVASQPEVLIFDDPAMGLDVVMRREFLDAMIDVLADTGVAVLFSSHILTDVERIADRIGILQHGAMLVDARLDDLKRRVRRWSWLPATSAAAPPAGDHVLRAARRRDGFDLTLLEPGERVLAELAGTGRLGEPASLSLEELFLDLTGPDGPGMLTEPLAELTARQEVTS